MNDTVLMSPDEIRAILQRPTCAGSVDCSLTKKTGAVPVDTPKKASLVPGAPEAAIPQTP